jgi:hypothetical protein
MIKFFRKIRQNLLTEGKTSKYFKYAIGEIVLVVIGILIALQINNWNENRKQNTEEIAILKNLYENLTLAKQQSKALILEEEALKKSLIFILGIDSNQINDTKIAISDSIFKSAVWDLQTNLPTVNAYINLKNTNKLSLIKSKKINEKFTDFEFSINKLYDLLEDRLNVHQIRIDAIFENDINFIPLIKFNIPTISVENETPNNYSQILTQKRIRNLLGMKLSFTQDVINYRKNLDTEIKELLLLLASELNMEE